jgi:uncharacterized membrane protein YphA (DoxX/SURF4 family)
VPSSPYAGDFETTAIPRYDSGTPSQQSSGYALLGDPEPLPYVQPPAARPPTYSVEPTEIEPDGGFGTREAGRRGTQDLGLLVLRVALGAVLVGHGLQKAFGLWGGQGLGAFRQSLTDMGYQHADILTYVAAGGQIAAGVLLILGLFTPVAAAGAVAYLVNALLAAVAAQSGRSIFAFRGSDPDRAGQVRIRRWTRLGATPIRRVGGRAGAGHRCRCRRVGAAERRQPAGLSGYSYGLGTRPSVTAVRMGSVAKVTAGSRTSEPSLR